MTSIVICDDNKLHANGAKERIREAFPDESFVFYLFADGASLLNSLEEKNLQPDLAILDIEMDGKNGIEIAAELNTRVPACRIIFLSGYAEYASDAYKTRHIWFVLKNKAEVFLIPAVRRALNSRGLEPCQVPIVIKADGQSFSIPADAVYYIERYGRKARVFSKEGQYETGKPPAKLIPEAAAKRFVRCHQGYWVNLAHIEALERNEFVLDNGSRIPISRTQKEEARRRFFDRYQ